MSIADKLTLIAENQEKVFEAGKQAEYDRFWDSFQENGNRSDYSYAFCKVGWNNETFKPKYPIKLVGQNNYIFDNCKLENFDFVEKGIILDFSKATQLIYIFRDAKGVKRIGIVDCRSCTNLNRLFFGCGVETIDGFIVSANITYENVFDWADKLVNLNVQGIIGQNGFSVSYSKSLSHDSIVSIINALSTTTSGLSVTLSKQAVDKAFETSDGAKDGSNSTEWQNLVNTKQNWTINLS